MKALRMYRVQFYIEDQNKNGSEVTFVASDSFNDALILFHEAMTELGLVDVSIESFVSQHEVWV